MTKLNLKELREDCESDKNCEFKDDRIINFKTIMPLLDWIERAKEHLEAIGECGDLLIGGPCDNDCDCVVCGAAKLLAELEEA